MHTYVGTYMHTCIHTYIRTSFLSLPPSPFSKYELANKERISVAAASKLLANIVAGYKGMGLSMVCHSSHLSLVFTPCRAP